MIDQLEEDKIEEAMDQAAGLNRVVQDEPKPEREPEYELEIFLSTDGKSTVRVKAVTPEGKKKAFEVAVLTYDKILARYGTKQGQAVREYRTPVLGQELAPVCPYHDRPMTKRQGSHGEFWSCGVKLSDGTWCQYRPPKKEKDA